MNRADSQKLIDTRRKMKDKKGADYAMRINDETWKKGSSQSRPPPGMPQRGPKASPVASSRSPMQGAQLPLPSGTQSKSPHQPVAYLRPSYMGPPMMGSIGYSPMSVSPVTPAVGNQRFAQLGSSSSSTLPPTGQPVTSTVALSGQNKKRPAQEITPSATKPPRSRAVRAVFDPTFSRKKRKKGNVEEETVSYFGPTLPQQPKTTALAVFNFLSNEDIYKAALVCKNWNKLAMDEELWKL
jgi:hypothetical protein